MQTAIRLRPFRGSTSRVPNKPRWLANIALAALPMLTLLTAQIEPVLGNGGASGSFTSQAGATSSGQPAGPSGGISNGQGSSYNAELYQQLVKAYVHATIGDGFLPIISLSENTPPSPLDPEAVLLFLLFSKNGEQDPVLATISAPVGESGAVFGRAMSQNIVVVGQALYGTGGAFRWTPDNGGTIAIIDPGFEASANAVNIDGTVVAGQHTFTSGFRWTAATGAVPISDLIATGISGDGSAIAGNTTGVHPHAGRWILTDPVAGTGVTTDLGSLAGDFGFSSAAGISGDGNVIVGQTADITGQFNHAFKSIVGDGTVMHDLGTADGLANSRALAVDRDGSVIVGESDDYSISHTDGYVAADGFSVPISSVATRWTSLTGARNLNTLLADANVNTQGYDLLTASSISADGQFISGLEVPVGSPANTPTTTYVVRYCDATTSAVCAAYDVALGAAVGSGTITTVEEQQRSVDGLAVDRFKLMAGEHGFAAPLLGDNSSIRSAC